MRRPRVICELNTYLGILLKAGLRSGEEGDQGPILLERVQEIEQEGPGLSAFFLHLHRVVPEKRAARAEAFLEASGDVEAGQRLEVRHPPLWVSCTYLAGVRGRSQEEEAEMIAALLRTLHDHPLLAPEHLPSIRGLEYADRYPLELMGLEEGWRELGLAWPRLTVAFRVTVPIPSALLDPLERVLDREIHLQELP